MGGFVGPEMCLLLVMPVECSKEKRCLGSLASLFNSRTVVVPVCSPSCHFPQFTTISSWSNTSCPSVQMQDTLPIFSHSSLTTPWLSSVSYSLIRRRWTISPLPHTPPGQPWCVMREHKASCPHSISSKNRSRSPGASAQDCWSPQGWKTEAGNLHCLWN